MLCFVVAPFVPLGPGAEKTATATKLKLAGGLFLGWIALTAWAGYSAIVAEAEFTKASLPMALVGGAILLLIAGGSVVFLWGTLMSLKAVFVRAKSP